MDLQLFDRHFQIYDDRFDYSNVSRIRRLPQKRIRFVYMMPVGMKRWFELTIKHDTELPQSIAED